MKHVSDTLLGFIQEVNLKKYPEEYARINHHLKALAERGSRSHSHQYHLDTDIARFIAVCLFCAKHVNIESLTLSTIIDMGDFNKFHLEYYLTQLFNNPKLRHFKYYQGNESINNETLQAIAVGILQNRNVTSLTIGHISPTSNDEEFIQEPAFLTGNAYLTLASTLSMNSTLLSLNLERGGLEDDSAYHLAWGLARNTTLTNINVSQNTITEKALAALASSLKNNNALTALNLGYQRSYSRQNDDVSALSNQLKEILCKPKLKVLNLNQLPLGNHLDSCLMTRLAPNASPLTLHLEATSLSDNTMVALCIMLNFNKIQALFLKDTALSNHAYLQLLNTIENNSMLLRVSLTEPQDTLIPFGSFLAKMITNNQSLTHLEITFNKSQQNRWENLKKALMANTTLTALWLYNGQRLRENISTKDLHELFERNHNLCYTYGDFTPKHDRKIFKDYLCRNLALEKNRFLTYFLKSLVRFKKDKKTFEEIHHMRCLYTNTLPTLFNLLSPQFPHQVHQRNRDIDTRKRKLIQLTNAS